MGKSWFNIFWSIVIYTLLIVNICLIFNKYLWDIFIILSVINFMFLTRSLFLKYKKGHKKRKL